MASVPIIELFGCLIVSIQGELDDRRTSQLREDIGNTIERREPLGLIIDLSGVEVLDSYLTRAIRDCAVGAHLMGVQTVVSGLGPEVALTLVEMDLTLVGANTAMNLEHALEHLVGVQLVFGQGHADGMARNA